MITHLSPTPDWIEKYDDRGFKTINLLNHAHIISKINSSKEERRSWSRMCYSDNSEIFESIYDKPSFCFENWETPYKEWFFIYQESKFTATTSERGTSYSIILENEEEFDSKSIGEKCVEFVEKMGMIQDTYRLVKIELSPEKRAEFLAFAYNLFGKEGA